MVERGFELYLHSLEELDLSRSSLLPSALSLIDDGSCEVRLVLSKPSWRDGISVTSIEGSVSAMVQMHRIEFFTF